MGESSLGNAMGARQDGRKVKTRLINAFFVLAILCGLVVFAFVLNELWKLRPAPVIANTPTILQQVTNLSQLVTVKYVMEKAVLLQDIQPYKDWVWPLGDSQVLLLARGIVKAGIDLKELKPEDVRVDAARKSITMTLPPSRVTDTYLDDHNTKVIERSTGLLRSFDKDLEQKAREQAVLELSRAAREAGILKEADTRAQVEVRGFLSQLGFTNVDVRPR